MRKIIIFILSMILLAGVVDAITNIPFEADDKYIGLSDNYVSKSGVNLPSDDYLHVIEKMGDDFVFEIVNVKDGIEQTDPTQFSVNVTVDDEFEFKISTRTYDLKLEKVGGYKIIVLEESDSSIAKPVKGMDKPAEPIFEHVKGVLEIIHKLIPLEVDFDNVKYTYTIVKEQAIDGRLSVRALMEEAVLFRKLAEMKKGFELGGPEALKKEKKNVVFEVPEPVSPIIKKPKLPEPIKPDEEAGIFGNEYTLEFGQLLEITTGNNLGFYSEEDVLSLDVDGGYIYFSALSNLIPSLLYINIQNGVEVENEIFELEDVNDEVVVGTHKIILSEAEGERIKVIAVDVSEIPVGEVEEEKAVATELTLDYMKTAGIEEVKQFIEENNLVYEDVEYLTRILKIERSCADEWAKERGAIAQVVLNRVYSSAYPNTVKDVVTADYDPSARNWFGRENPQIRNEKNGINNNENRGCVISALNYFMCQGEEDDGAKMIKGRNSFVHRARLDEIPEWNEVNPIKVQEGAFAATFSGSDDKTEMKCSERNYRSLPKVATVEGLCYPLEESSLKRNLNNFGDARSGGKRCHVGVDLLTNSPGRVLAVDDGVVNNIFKFTSCTDGWSGNGDAMALVIYHPNLGKSINYGEIDKGEFGDGVKVGAEVKKGQYLGKAGHCGMLHFELYNKEVSSNEKYEQWKPPKGESSSGYKNKCAKEFTETKPVSVEDPTDLLKGLAFCPSTEAVA